MPTAAIVLTPLLGLPLLGLTLLALPAGAAPRTESAQQYDARLAQTEAALQRMEQGTVRPLGPEIKKLESYSAGVSVRRPDGKSQPAETGQWDRLNKNIAGNATREQVRQARETVAMRRKAVSVWAGTATETTLPPTGANGGAATASDLGKTGPVDALAMVRQLESTGQIRTGPTRMQQMVSDAKKWAKNAFLALVKWIGSLFPANANAQPPKINWKVVTFIFWATVLALLIVIVYLVWKAVGGRWDRQGARRLVRFEGSEDSELLVLPPDELRERARQLAASGNFREALRHLYIALLLTLDARGVWHYDTRRTNWEHIAALRSDPTRLPMVAPLSDLTRRFDRVRYGNATCDNADWTRFERDVVQLEEKTPTATAARPS